MDKAVVLVSGGINSSVAAALACEQYEPALLHVEWHHHAARREHAAFERVAEALDIKTTAVAALSYPPQLNAHARASERMTTEETATHDRGTPATFLPGLLPGMLSIATTWAGTLGARHIVIGISEDHGTPGRAISELYPDHRIEFLQTFNLMLNYATPAERHPTVEAPLIELTRAEVVRLGQRLEVPFDKTWSCYQSSEMPCGRCRPCKTRAAGFLRARIPDPLLLEPAAGRVS